MSLRDRIISEFRAISIEISKLISTWTRDWKKTTTEYQKKKITGQLQKV